MVVLISALPVKGYLDEQFNQLEELQDESSPNFVEEVVPLFLKDSPRLLANIEQTIGKYPQDFCRLDSLLHQLKGSGSSIGAVRMKNECSVFKAHCNDKNLEGCRRSLQKMKRDHATLKQKLEKFFCAMHTNQRDPVSKYYSTVFNYRLISRWFLPEPETGQEVVEVGPIGGQFMLSFMLLVVLLVILFFSSLVRKLPILRLL